MRQAEKGDGLIWILEKEYRPVFYWYETDFE